MWLEGAPARGGLIHEFMEEPQISPVQNCLQAGLRWEEWVVLFCLGTATRNETGKKQLKLARISFRFILVKPATYVRQSQATQDRAMAGV